MFLAQIFSVTHLPVLGLVNSLRVRPSETALAVQSRDGGAELRHGVQVGGEVVQHGDHVRGKGRTLSPLLRQPIHLKKTANKELNKRQNIFVACYYEYSYYDCHL